MAMPSALRSAKYCVDTEKTISSFSLSCGGKIAGLLRLGGDDLLGDLEVAAEEQARARRGELDALASSA